MYQVKPEVINQVLNYLATKPYQEVVDLIQALQSGEVIEESPSEESND